MAGSVKTTKMVFKFHPDVAERLRALVKANPPLTLSGFAQDAIARSMRSWRPTTEFIDEGRERQERSVLPGALDLTLDRPDGVPVACASYYTERDWQDVWKLTSNIRDDINDMRDELGRSHLTDAEWKAIVKHMGSEPGTSKSKGQQWEARND